MLSSREGMFDVQSTDVYRTIQSGYSELHGVLGARNKDENKDLKITKT